MWLARSLSEKPLTMTLGLASSAYTGLLGSSLFGCSPSWTWSEGEDLGLPTGQETLTSLGDKEGGGEGGGDWEGVGKRGVNGNFYNLIKLLSRKTPMIAYAGEDVE